MFVKRGTCKHYRDSVLLGMPCRKGVPVLEKCIAASARIEERPCHEQGKGCFVCELYEEPSTRDLEEQARAFHELMERTMLVRRALAETPRGPGTAGEVTCPVCGGGLHWSRDQHGEISARCSTEGCVSFPFSEDDVAPLRRELITEQKLTRKPPRLTK